jgi:anthranilate synthase component 2
MCGRPEVQSSPWAKFWFMNRQMSDEKSVIGQVVVSRPGKARAKTKAIHPRVVTTSASVMSTRLAMTATATTSAASSAGSMPTAAMRGAVRRAPTRHHRQHRYQRRGLNAPTFATRPRGTALAAASSDRPVVIIDNYDSFTYNLSQYLGDCGCEHVVYKNDEKTVDEIRRMNPRGVMVSPGPGRPEDSGISLQACAELGPEFGVFGVCMGHQCIGQVFGGKIVRAPTGLMHGKSSLVWHRTDMDTVLSGLPDPFQAARYHSLVISRDGFPEDELEVTAWTEDETIMAVKHKKYPLIQGVQFHPESIITENGLLIIKNWVRAIDEAAKAAA